MTPDQIRAALPDEYKGITKAKLDRAMDIFGSAEWSIGSREAMLKVLQDYESTRRLETKGKPQ